MSRPPILFPLFAEVTGLPGVGPKSAQLYEKLGVQKIADLLFLLPTGVIDRRPRESLVGIEPGQVATVEVEVGEHYKPRGRNQPYRVHVQGGGVYLELVFFHAKDNWVTRALPQGERRVISGRVELYEGHLQMAHPDLILTPAEAKGLAPFEPVYPLTQGLTQRALARAMAGALTKLPDLPEWLDPGIKDQHGWLGWAEAVRAVHQPDSVKAISYGAAPRQRLAYDELLSHQLALQIARTRMRRGKGRPSAGDGTLREAAASAFGYDPTGAQTRTIGEIEADMSAPERMMRLLQGDVGSGKTWVALMAMLIAAEAGGQGALMAPTEILARQHAAGLESVCAKAGVRLVLLTGRDKGAAREEKLAAIGDGSAQLIIGTHALFQQDVAFRDLRLAVVDEQHRFGVRQRMDLTAKAPGGADVLVMTATPIPRTLALAGYGDLDISILDEKPPGRHPVDTRLVSMGRYDDVVARLKAVIEKGQRAYWVCPLVEESDTVPLIAAEDRHRALAAVLGSDNVALVHGQMPAEQKDAAMADFQSGARRVLVATTVIEVGVDVPEATIMVIEQAETFGLAQLHQLRGRVGRGAGQSYCLMLYAPPLGETARARLEIMRQTEDGFRIAEEDLKIRGAGDVLGTAQSGLPRFRIASLENDVGLMALARDDARMVMTRDPELTTERGNALRTLLYLMERDASVLMMKSG
ncbi:MAG: ATP-dependent DNA helicase RecG [Paracoccaceae bacterium]|nr:ATP-dependent DNA helicase RecG [Paracoccaceae bacterium]